MLNWRKAIIRLENWRIYNNTWNNSNNNSIRLWLVNGL